MTAVPLRSGPDVAAPTGPLSQTEQVYLTSESREADGTRWHKGAGQEEEESEKSSEEEAAL